MQAEYLELEQEKSDLRYERSKQRLEARIKKRIADFFYRYPRGCLDQDEIATIILEEVDISDLL